MYIQLKVGAFIIVSVGFAWLSRKSLVNPRTHGFYRFFAWEAVLALLLLNINYWFYLPFSLQQVVSWFFLIVCTYLVIQGILSLSKIGKPDRQRNDPTLIGIEKTTILVTTGIYRYIRHPLYGSLLFLAWGVFFKHPSRIGIALAVLATCFLIVTAKKEEFENIRFFGIAYQGYMEKTRMFIPFFF